MTSFLQLEGLHVFITGAAGGIGSALVQEFMGQGCKVSAHDLRPNSLASTANPSLRFLQGDISNEEAISASITQAVQTFGPIHILCANAGITDESNNYPIWDMPTELWDRTYAINVRGTYLTIKHFLKSVESSQTRIGKELDNVSIIVTGSECGVFGQAGHVEYASGKAGLQYGLVRTVKNEIVRLNGEARINAVAPGWVDTKLIEGRLDDPQEMWREAQATYVHSCLDRPKIKILLSVDFDAVSGWLGTGQHPDNNLADYSAGFFSAYVGVPRLLKLFKKHGVQDRLTWFVPMHSAESFPKEFASIVESGAEIGLHGYCHEGAPQLTPSQEREVLEHCIDLYRKLTGQKPVGYRAPLYELRESTVQLLEEHDFLYDSSLSHHDSKPYYLPSQPPIHPPTYNAETSAKDWMKPLPQPFPPTAKTLIEVPSNWYAEDMTPMQFWPHTPNSQGYIDARVMENMWKDKFEWVRTEVEDLGEKDTMVFPLVLHPDTSGMAHVIGMIDRIIMYLKGWGDEVEFCTFADAAKEWKAKNAVV
ncbi:hypothetical protein E8E11_007135 [Didymella keratinophila]|nr:hypothetical protein E8E11_007135 [Didymella keratinophila]